MATQSAKKLQWDQKHPYDQCSDAEVLCSNCVPHPPEQVDPQTSRVFPLRHSYRRSIRSYGRSIRSEEGSNPDPVKVKSTSRAPSIASSGTSYSAMSTRSARYSVKLGRRISANSRRHSGPEAPTISKSARPQRPSLPPLHPVRRQEPLHSSDGRAEYFRCPIVDCKEVFHSREDLESHEISLHFQNYCTFCNRSCRISQVWREHEQRHICEKIKSSKIGDILWSCGICPTFGLSETRRYLHIRQHWNDSLSMYDWTGAPRLRLLSPKEITILQNMPDDEFRNTAAALLCSSGSRFRSATDIISRALRIDRLPAKTTADTALRTDDGLEEGATSPNPMLTSLGTPQPIVHGLFASLRRRLPRFTAKHS